MTEPRKKEERLAPGAGLAWAAARHRNREAIVDGGRRFTYQDLHRRTNRLANALLAHGLAAEGRVAKLMNNCAEIVEIHFGTVKAGGASVSLHARNTSEEHLHMLNDSESEILFADAAHKEQVLEIRERCGHLRLIVGVGWEEDGVAPYEDLLARASVRDPGTEVPLDALYHLPYTSGTTGKAKGVINTHRTNRAWLSNFFANLDIRMCPADSMIHVGPLTHAAFSYLEPCLLRGVRNLILPRFDPERFFRTVAQERATIALLVPTMIRMLLDSDERAAADLSSLHTINYGASPIPDSLLGRALEAFGPVFRQHFGMTEARQPITVLSAEEHLPRSAADPMRRLSSCGKPARGVRLALLDDGDEPAGPGETGELCVRGEFAMAGYWKDPEATAETTRNGWVHSGDLATADEEGYIYIVDRKKDMIISGGFNIYPREVEETLCRHPDVQEAVVIGVPDERWGEAVKALVVLRPGGTATASELIEFSRKKIASYKKPKHIEFTDALPRNARGKVLRRALRDRHWQNMARKVN